MAVNLRRIRHEKNLTQEQLAERTNVSMRYIGSIERGKVSASVTVLGQIAEALDIDPCELLRRKTFAIDERQEADRKADER